MTVADPLFKCPECPHAVVQHTATGCIRCACRARRAIYRPKEDDRG